MRHRLWVSLPVRNEKMSLMHGNSLRQRSSRHPVVPIPQGCSALAFHVLRTTGFPCGGTAMRRIKDGDFPLVIAIHDAAHRVPEAISITGLYQGNLRLHRIQKRRTTGGFATVMGYQEHSRLK